MRALPAIVTSAALLLTAGCSVHDATPRHDASARPTTPTRTSGPDAVSPTASASPVTRTCSTPGLSVSVRPDPGGGHAGSTVDDVRLRNTSGSACLMTGWPGVSFVAGSHGRQVGSPAARQGTPRVVRLAPGDTATALLQVADPGDFSPCTVHRVRGLRVYPPNQRDAVFVPLPSSACTQTSAGQLTVQPVRT
ncbi:MAG: DUF4232 domain-containing protein [Aeromicrobium erythreum]